MVMIIGGVVGKGRGKIIYIFSISFKKDSRFGGLGSGGKLVRNWGCADNENIPNEILKEVTKIHIF